jgi:hypothetical protein
LVGEISWLRGVIIMAATWRLVLDGYCYGRGSDALNKHDLHMRYVVIFSVVPVTGNWFR